MSDPVVVTKSNKRNAITIVGAPAMRGPAGSALPGGTTGQEKVAEVALLATFPDEQTLSGDKKVERFKIALRVHGNEDISVGDAATILKLIEKAWGVLIVGRATELINGPQKRPRAVKEAAE